MLGLIIDAAVLFVIGFCAFRGWKSGVVRGVFGFLALILSVTVANAAATAYSGEITGMIRPFVGGLVDSKMSDILTPGQVSEIDVDADEAELPQTYFVAREALRGLGVFEPAAKKISEFISTQTQEVGYALSAFITERLSETLAYIAVFAVAFILLVIAVSVIGNLVNIAFSLPGLHLVDSIAGLAFGALRGLVLVMFAATVFRYLGLISASMIEETVLVEYLVLHNPIANALGI